jgi:hypothetical protein
MTKINWDWESNLTRTNWWFWMGGRYHRVFSGHDNLWYKHNLDGRWYVCPSGCTWYYNDK